MEPAIPTGLGAASLAGEPEIRQRALAFPEVGDLQATFEDGFGKPDLTVEHGGPGFQETESPRERGLGRRLG